MVDSTRTGSQERMLKYVVCPNLSGCVRLLLQMMGNAWCMTPTASVHLAVKVGSYSMWPALRWRKRKEVAASQPWDGVPLVMLCWVLAQVRRASSHVVIGPACKEGNVQVLIMMAPRLGHMLGGFANHRCELHLGGCWEYLQKQQQQTEFGASLHDTNTKHRSPHMSCATIQKDVGKWGN